MFLKIKGFFVQFVMGGLLIASEFRKDDIFVLLNYNLVLSRGILKWFKPSIKWCLKGSRG